MTAQFWPVLHSKALAEMMPLGKSFAVMADDLNRRFGSSYSRNSVIGRANRMFGPGTKGPSIVTKVPHKAKVQAVPRPKPKVVVVAPRPQREKIEVMCREITTSGVALADLEPGQCRYPYGDGPYTFCGHAAVVGFSYCEPHRLLCTRDSVQKPANPNWLNAVRAANVPKAIALSSGDWEAA
jgi:GcrA cell cycle regulator